MLEDFNGKELGDNTTLNLLFMHKTQMFVFSAVSRNVYLNHKSVCKNHDEL